MSLYRHCDGPDCDSNQRAVTSLHDGWFHIEDMGEQTLYHFCDPDCAMRWFASWSSPTQEIENGGIE